MLNTTAITRLAGNLGLKLKQHAPTILFVTGIGTGIAATVQACKETSAAEKVLDEHNDRLDKIHYVNENCDEMELPYTDEDYRRDIFGEYVKTGAGLAKAYGPALAFGTISIVSLISSHAILLRREAQITSAYSALLAAFEAYRAKVKEMVGDENEKQIASETKKALTNGDPVNTLDIPDDSIRGRFYYGPYFYDADGNKVPNKNWDSIDNDRNILFLTTMERYIYEQNETYGHVFLSKALNDALNFPDIYPFSHVYGWSKKLNPASSVDLGFRNDSNFMNGVRDDNGDLMGVWLEPNYDGLIINNYVTSVTC